MSKATEQQKLNEARLDQNSKVLYNLYRAAQQVNYPNDPILPEWIMDGQETATALHTVSNYICELYADLEIAQRELNRKKTLKEKLIDLFK